MDYEQLKALIEQRGVHAVFGDYGEGWGIEQNAEELARFLVHMQQLGVESVLEIGTGYKAGLARFLHDDLGWRVTSVDIKNYGHQHDGITFLQTPPEGDRWQGSLDSDLVIIDGDHAYDAVKADHEWYATWAQKVIAFHDIAGLRDCEGVRDYWWLISDPRDDGELKSGYYEIIADSDQRGGIGYIVLAEVEAPAPATEAPKVAAKKPAPRKPAARKPAAKKAPVKK